jgi:hypothetical protein
MAKSGKVAKSVSAPAPAPANSSFLIYAVALVACGVAFVANNYLADDIEPGVLTRSTQIPWSNMPYIARQLYSTYPKEIELCMNGEHEGCRSRVIDGAMRSYSRDQLVKVLTKDLPANYVDDEGQPRLFSERGFIISSANELSEGERVNVVPYSKQYVRPAVAVGHRVAVEDIDQPVIGKPIEVETLETTPRVFMIHNFMNEVEMDNVKTHVLNIKDEAHRMKRSGVGAQDNGVREDGSSGGLTESIRTSTNAWDSQSPSAKVLIRRAFKIAGINYMKSMEDGIQVLHYAKNKAYIPHHDYFTFADPSTHPHIPAHNFFPEKHGTNRLATVFLYFSDTDEGGGTVFPTLESNYCKTHQNCTIEGEEEFVDIKAGLSMPNVHGETNTGKTWEEKMAHQCIHRFSVKPRKGSAIIFYSQHPNGTLNYNSLHGGCPVLKGEKWAANLWIWNGPRYILANKMELAGEGYHYKAAGPSHNSQLGKREVVKKSNGEFSAKFKNMVGEELEMYWVDQGGAETLIMKMSGAGANVNTFVGHMWRARKTKEAGGTLVAEVKMVAGQQVYTIPREF